MKPKIKMKVIKEDMGYSAYTNVGDDLIATCGDTLEELKEMVLDAVNLSFEDKGFILLSNEYKTRIR